MIAHLAETVPDEKVLNGVRIMNTARESYLNRLYAEVDRHYGSMDAFCGRDLALERKKSGNYGKTTWNSAGEHIFSFDFLLDCGRIR